jgi:hypothetical protein
MRASLFIVFFSITLVVACGPSEQQKAQERVARESLKTLQKLEAATEVGVNKLQYGPMLIEAKAALNESNRLLPDSRLKQELNEAMQVFQDADTVWNSSSSFINTTSEPGRTIQAKYKIPLYEAGNMSYLKNTFYSQDALPLIWPAAKPHIDEATKLLEQKQ